MSVTVRVIPLDDRRSAIEQTEETERTYSVPFRGQRINPRTRRIPLDLPIYRVANMRTSVRQRAYATRHRLPEDYFTNGQEDPSVQQAQHGILAELSKDAKANIYQRLEETAEQEDPLIVTVGGVVLNGNRRFAAMRELYDSDPSRYQRFSHVEVAVLPADATEDDLTAIETQLQIRPDLKLEYGWVEKAIGLRRQRTELGWSLSKAAEAWGDSEAELNALLVRLDVADDYLSRYIGSPGDYSEVAAHEQAFRTFVERQRARQGSVDPSRLEAERQVMFAVLANHDPDYRPGRVYDYARQIDEITSRVLPQLATDDATAPALAEDGLDPLDAIGEAPRAVPDPVLNVLRSSDRGVEVAQLASDALDAVDMARRAARRGEAVLEAARKINSLLSSIDVGSARPSTVEPALVQFASALDQLVDRIVQMTAAHPAARASLDAVRLRGVASKINHLARSLD